MLEFHRYPDFTPTPTEYDEMIDDLEKKIEKLEEQINDLDFENGELQDEIEHLKATRIPVDWLINYFNKKCMRINDLAFIDNHESKFDVAVDRWELIEDWRKENEID